MDRWLLTGPTYGDATRFENYRNCAFVILGDSNLLNRKTVKELEGSNVYYCVRGLDEKPKYVDELEPIFDEEVNGLVWINPDYPDIRFLEDGEIYNFGGAKTLVLGGGTNPNIKLELSMRNKDLTLDTSLTKPENIAKRLKGKDLDLVLSYTAKIKDLNGPTEEWVDKILRIVGWKHWIIGRFKEDVNISDRIMYINEDIIDFKNFVSEKEVIEENVEEYDNSEKEFLNNVE